MISSYSFCLMLQRMSLPYRDKQTANIRKMNIKRVDEQELDIQNSNENSINNYYDTIFFGSKNIPPYVQDQI